jgi:UDP-N-acetylmuramate-alanine ligase
MVSRTAQEVKPGDMVLTLGAGDIYQVGDLLLARLRDRFGENGNQAG